MTQGAADFNVRYVLRALRRRLLILVLCVVLLPAAAVGFSLLQKKQYTATATLLFRNPEFDQKLFGAQFIQGPIDPAREAATNLALVTLRQVAALTAAQLHGVTEDQVFNSISASSQGQSDLVTLQATASTPGFAAKLANTYADQFISFRRAADRAKIEAAETPLRRRIAALTPAQQSGLFGRSLQQRLGQLTDLAALQTGNAEKAQPAEIPRSPSSPKPVRNGLLGFFLALVVGLALVVLAEALDRRLRDAGESEQMFERPLLVTLPHSKALEHPDPALLSIPAHEREAFRMLWTSLRYFGLSRDMRSVLITSADRDDGKTTVAWGLGVAAASAGTRILVVEADLRNPSFAQRFGLTSTDGLTGVLAGDLTLEQATVRVPLPLDANDSGPSRSLEVLTAGPRPPDPTDLLQSHRMAEFVREVEANYDLVIIDTPPAAIVSDAVPIIALAGGVIVVVRLGNTIRDHARRLRQQLDHMRAPVLGVVVNDVGASEAYAYDYGYAYADPADASPSANGAQPVGGGEAVGNGVPGDTAASREAGR